MGTLVALDNPYWASVEPAVAEADRFWGGGTVARWGHDSPVSRTELVDQYAWTITDPATVAFIAEHADGRVVDPLAGSGYWLYLLGQLGIDCVGYDLNPPSAGANQWHKSGTEHAPVLPGDAVDVATVHSDRTLLLSWPPYDESVGSHVLAAYSGERVIYIGEGEGGCCGAGDMFGRLAADWRVVAEHRPVQWEGIHDYVTVYERAGAA